MKAFFRDTKTERTHHYETCIIQNARGSPSDKKKMIADGSLFPHKETKFI